MAQAYLTAHRVCPIPPNGPACGYPVPWLFLLFIPTWAPLLGSESLLYHPCQAPHPVTVSKLIQAPK